MRRLTIAVDIDGTLRDLETQMDKYLEIDHPDKVEEFREIKDKVYQSLDPVFETREDVFTWMYEERVFELFGMAERMHKKVIDDLNIFTNVAKAQGFDVVIASVQRNQSVTATMHWLAKWGCKVQRYEFFNTMQEKIDRGFDFYVDDCPEVMQACIDSYYTTKHDGTKLYRMTGIKIPYEFTKDIECPSLDITNGNFDDLYGILGIEKVLKK